MRRCPTSKRCSTWGWTNKVTEPGTYTWDIHAGAGQSVLSKGTVVGQVTVKVSDAGKVNVTYEVDAPYTMAEAHLWVGSTPLPEKAEGKGKNKVLVPTAAPGQFPFSPVISQDGRKATFEWSGKAPGLPIYVAAHAVVGWCEG